MTRPSKSLDTAAPPPPPPPQQILAAESDMVVILSALLCALICAAGLAAVIRCACLRRFTQNSPPSPNKGLKKKALQSLPRSTFIAADKSNSGADLYNECAICLTDFSDGEEIRILPLCGHSFHLICIDKWLSSKSSCPSCRRILTPVRCDRCGYSATVPRHHQHHQEDEQILRLNSAEFLP